MIAVADGRSRSGYGLEMARAVLAQAHERGHRRIRASTDVADVASQRLLVRLGFGPVEAATPLLHSLRTT